MLAAHFNWAAPFYVLVLACVIIWPVALAVMPQAGRPPGAKPRPLSAVLPDLLGLFAVGATAAPSVDRHGLDERDDGDPLHRACHGRQPRGRAGADDLGLPVRRPGHACSLRA